MIEIQTYGSLKDGAFWPRRSQTYLQQIQEAGNVHDCLLTITGINKRTIDQNSYAWVVCNEIALAMRQSGWVEVTKDDIYYRIEEKHCKTTRMNEETGEIMETIKPLKKQEPDRFWEIIEETRVNAMQNLDVIIQTPAQHYGISEEAYDLMKMGVINYIEAKKMNDKKFNPEKANVVAPGV